MRRRTPNPAAPTKRVKKGPGQGERDATEAARTRGRGRGGGRRRPGSTRRVPPPGPRAPVRLRGRAGARFGPSAPRALDVAVAASPARLDAARAVGRGSIDASGARRASGTAASQPGGARAEQVARGRWSGARLGLGSGSGGTAPSCPARREWVRRRPGGEPGWARAGAGRRTADPRLEPLGASEPGVRVGVGVSPAPSPRLGTGCRSCG